MRKKLREIWPDSKYNCPRTASNAKGKYETEEAERAEHLVML